MKILVTLDFPPETGGIQQYLHDIVMHTFSREDLVLCGTTLATSLENDCRYPCRIRRVRFPGAAVNKKMLLLPLLPEAVRIVVRKQPFVMVAGNIYAAVVPWLLSWFFPVEYNVYCYGTELLPAGTGRLRSMLWKAILKKAATVYYLTGATLRLLSDGYSCKRCIQWVPRIDLPSYTIARKESPHATVYMLSVGRLVPHKGHRFLVEAASRLSLPEKWHLTIIGSGPEYRSLTELIRRLSLEDKVTIATTVSSGKLIEYYVQADIFVLPSVAAPTGIEGFGIVLLEAMAYGAALVASRSGGIEEVVDGNSLCAELVAPGDPEVLRIAMERLIADSERRYCMAVAARTLLEQRYVWK